jgi:hypothetical protein
MQDNKIRNFGLKARHSQRRAFLSDQAASIRFASAVLLTTRLSSHSSSQDRLYTTLRPILANRGPTPFIRQSASVLVFEPRYSAACRGLRFVRFGYGSKAGSIDITAPPVAINCIEGAGIVRILQSVLARKCTVAQSAIFQEMFIFIHSSCSALNLVAKGRKPEALVGTAELK